ncbi:adenosine deaminase [Micrococcales bacterium 31B]|nr:adenosine deaminase [Micrococcales bacterium 31B]
MSRLSLDTIATLPKAVLHDHLDGALRPLTVWELAHEIGHDLPVDNGQALGTWFHQAADSGSLVQYLETFKHTVAVMQTEAGLMRVCREYVLDLAADGVVYGETRYAPELFTEGALSMEDVVQIVQQGLAEGMQAAAELGSPVRVGTILCAMRMAQRSYEVAELALRYRDRGVVGFDIAGAELGFPASDHKAAFDLLHENNFPVTIHAGEADGLESIWQAVSVCNTQRIGHGVRIAEDISSFDPATAEVTPDSAMLGQLASWVRDRRIALEVAPCSNVQTGASESIAKHQITLLHRLGFNVTLNTDNRLMSATSMTHEMAQLVAQAGWTAQDLYIVTVNALESAFIPWDERNAIIRDVIDPGYAPVLEDAPE